MATTKNAPAEKPKTVVLTTYRFKHINRVCFVVLSSKGDKKYRTCFDNGKATCTCPATVECRHIKDLRPRAELLTQAAPVAVKVPVPVFSTSEQREGAPLNGNRAFSLMR